MDQIDRFVGSGSEYDDDLLQIYQTFPKSNKEKWLYSLASFIYKKYEFGAVSTPQLIDQQSADCIYENIGEPPYKCGWLSPEIVCDIHTGNVAKTPESLYKFATEGAKVINERKKYLDPELRKIYIENKIHSDKEHNLPPLRKKGSERGTFLSEPLYAQKVTAAYKPFTYVTREKIYKGPIDSKKADEIIAVAKRFLALEDSSVLIPEKIKAEGNYYLSYENVGESWDPKFTFTVVKNSKTEQIMGNVVERKSIGIYQGSELISLNKMDYDKMFWHFMVRYILGRGDSGLWNYINNHGIDFDDRRQSFDQKNILELLFTKKQKDSAVLEQQLALRKNGLAKKLMDLELIDEESDRRDNLLEALSIILGTDGLGKPIPGVPGLFIKLDYITKEEESMLLRDLSNREWNTTLSRRIMHFGKTYQYGDKKLGDAPKIPKKWEWLKSRVEGDMGRIDQVIVNEYLPGQGIGPHTDSPLFGPVIASLSTGSGCKMDFSNASKIISVYLPPRSIVFLTGDSRNTWKHSIAPRKTDDVSGKKVDRGTRTSFTFRSVL